MLRLKPPWLQALFPWEHQALRVNGRTMAYLDEGLLEARPHPNDLARGHRVTHPRRVL